MTASITWITPLVVSMFGVSTFESLIVTPLFASRHAGIAAPGRGGPGSFQPGPEQEQPEHNPAGHGSCQGHPTSQWQQPRRAEAQWLGRSGNKKGDQRAKRKERQNRPFPQP